MMKAMQIMLWTLVLIGMHPALAQPNSRQRLAAFAKLPDWTGVWERFNVGPSGGPSEPTEGAAFGAAFAALRPPYNAEWEAKYQMALQAREQSHEVPQVVCSGLGFPQAMLFPAEMIQTIVTPEETTFMFYTGGARHVATDGRAHPPTAERWFTRWGDAVGRWQGQTLVVDTVASNAPIITPEEVPVSFSTQVHVVERIRLRDNNTLENQMTIEDPVALTQPWVMTIDYHRVPGLPHVADYDCAADRNPVVDGKFTIAPR